uniref:Phospholipid scramblase n=1 Tax=Lynx canadensis TaxID=61383 RepID=A0A667HM14_LYNCA
MPEPVPVPNCPPGLEDLVAQLEMQWPPGVTAGFALEHWNPCRTLYSIQSKKKEKVMGVRGPRSTHGWGSDSAFEWMSRDIVKRAPDLKSEYLDSILTTTFKNSFNNIQQAHKFFILPLCFLRFKLSLMKIEDKVYKRSF